MASLETARLVFFARRANGKKRTLIRAIMNPPSFHLTTRSQGVVPPPFVEETPHLALDRPGRLAPAWLEALISGNLCDQEPNILDVGCANSDARSKAPKTANSIPLPDRHELLLKGHQSMLGEPTRRADGRECNDVYACVCQNCRYHFTFYIDRNKGKSCGQHQSDHGGDRKDEKDPFHHLVFVLSNTKAPPSINTQYYPYCGQADYICSAKGCSFRLSIEVSAPRLARHFLDYLCDNDRITRRLALALEREPERFADMKHVKPNALQYLRIYLRDIVENRKDVGADGVEAERKIDQRNKKFYVQFGDGPDAAELFSFLGFELRIDGESRIWKVPNPPILRPTRPGSHLAFYQDIKSEVETIIGKDSQNMKPNSAISFITNGLDIGPYATTRKDYTQYRTADYDLLGLLPDMHESYFWYAFGCQHQTDPANDLVYFRALQQLARGRENEELEMRVQSYDSILTNQPTIAHGAGTSGSGTGNVTGPAVGASTRAAEEDEIRLATELSLRDLQSMEGAEVSAAAAASTASYYEQQQQQQRDSQQRHGISEASASEAYNYFGARVDDRSDSSIVEKFLTLCDSYPSQRSMYREKLLLLARYTGSQELRDTAYLTMGLDEALTYLGVQKDSDPEYIFNVTQFICNSGEKDLSLVARALQVIGAAYNEDHPDDTSFSNAAAMVLAQSEGGGVNDGYSPGDSNGSVAPYIQMMDLDQSSAERGTGAAGNSNPELPVGLINIRNTCYLNSILQYFFTVNPVRAIVLDYDQYGFELTPENLQHRRIDPGSTHLELGEAYAGQQFVQQLASLFQELLTCQSPSCRPPQRLALAALKNAKQLELDGAKILARDQDQSSLAFDLGPPPSGRTSPAPPLPARHAPSVPLQPPPRPERPPTATAAAAPMATAAPVDTVAPAETVMTTKSAATTLDADLTDSASSRSSQTLVNQAEENNPQTVGENLLSTVAGADKTTSSDVAMDVVSVPDAIPGTDDAIVVEDEQLPSYSEIETTGKPFTDTTQDDVAMADAETGTINITFDPPPVAEASVEEKIGRALNDSSVTGTDQQDVEEVMGNIISHLRAAVKATGEDDETGAQKDPVTDTFFWTSVTYSRHNGAAKYNRQVAPNRWVTAYPDEGGQVIGLLDALDNSFRREFISQGPSAGRYERFTSILKLPPILHIHIQRTTRDGGKNNAAIDIPSVLHLDRFMDSPLTQEGKEDHAGGGLDLFSRRRRAWNLQERLRALRGPGGEYADLDFPPTAIGQAAAYTDLLMDEYLGTDGKKPKWRASGSVQAHTNDTDADMTEKEDTSDDESDYFVITDEVMQLLNANGIALEGSDELERAAEAAVTRILEPKINGSEAHRRFAEEAFGMTRADVAAAWRPTKGATSAQKTDGGHGSNRSNSSDDGNNESADEEDERFPPASAGRRKRTKIPPAAAAANTVMASRNMQAEQYQAELQGLFADLQAPESAYRLHAVICHAGQTGKSGHYWVWIYDFAQEVWRRYNDSTVTEERDTDKVMRALSTQGEPYYLAYVQVSDVERMVSIPARTVAVSEATGPAPASAHAGGASAVTVRETSAIDLDDDNDHDEGGHRVTTALRPAPTRALRPLQPSQPSQSSEMLPGRLPGPPPGPPPQSSQKTDAAANAAARGLSSVQELDEDGVVEAAFGERS